MPIDETCRQFEIVYIAADSSVTIQQKTVPVPPGNTLSAMIDFVKQQIEQNERNRRKKLSQSELQKERSVVASQLREQLKNNPQLSNVTLTDDIIDRIFLTSAVDCVILEQNCPATNFHAVMMYVDDQGVSKQLPRNDRATGMCFALGNRTEVLGDVYIASFIDNDDDFIRLDFTLQSLSDQRWIQLARGLHTGVIKRTMTAKEASTILQLDQKIAAAAPAPATPTAAAAEAEAAAPEAAAAGTNTDMTAKEGGETKPSNETTNSTVLPSTDVVKAYSAANTVDVKKTAKPAAATTTTTTTTTSTTSTSEDAAAGAAKPEAATTPAVEHLCANGRLDCTQKGTMRCTRCKNIHYCSPTHQKLDWARHKPDCIKPK